MFNKYSALLIIRLGITGFKFIFFLFLASLISDEDIALVFFFHAGIGVFVQIITFDIYIPYLQKFNRSNNLRYKGFLLKSHLGGFLIRSAISLSLLTVIYFLFSNSFPIYFTNDIFLYFIVILFVDAIINDLLRYLQVFDVIGQVIVMSLRNFFPYLLFLISPYAVEHLFGLIIFFGILSVIFGVYRLIPLNFESMLGLRAINIKFSNGFAKYFRVILLRSLYFNMDKFILGFFLEPALYSRYSFYSTIGQVFHLVVQTVLVQPKLKLWFLKDDVTLITIKDILKSVTLSIFILLLVIISYYILKDYITIYELGQLGFVVLLGYSIGSALILLGAYTYCKYSFEGVYSLHKVGCASFIISSSICFLADTLLYFPFVFYCIFSTMYLIYTRKKFGLFTNEKI